jgi:hypothetical protein
MIRVMYSSWNMTFTLALLVPLTVFSPMEKIVHYGCFFIFEKFHEQIPIKTNIF